MTFRFYCSLFQTHYDYFICIPFRTEITHKYSYHFKKSIRSITHNSGLDYSKIVIISKTIFLDDKDAIIDKDEYKETIANLEKIKREAFRFVEDYVSHINGEKRLHPSEFKRRYRYSPLKYFHKELKIQ